MISFWDPFIGSTKSPICFQIFVADRKPPCMAIPFDDVFMFLDFCVAAQTQEMPSSSKSKGKMKYQYNKELAHANPSSVASVLDNVMDTMIGHVDMADFLWRVENLVGDEMKHIKRSNIDLVSAFPMAAMEPDFVLGCIWHSTPKTKTIKDADRRVIISLDPKVIEKIFKVPHKAECVDLTKESS